MPTINAKPDTVLEDYIAPTGTASEITALTDGSDSTYCKVTSYTTRSLLSYNAESFAAGERIVSICPYVRHKCSGSKVSRAKVVGQGRADLNGDGVLETFYVDGASLEIAANATAANYALAAQNGQLLNPATNTEWPTATSPILSSIFDPNTPDASRAWWYEAGLYIYATKAATVANPTAPTGTISTTQYPTMSATVSSVVESWQVPSGLDPFMCGVTVEYSLFSGSLTSPSGTALFTMLVEDTISTYGDGTTPTTKAVTATPPIPIPNGNWTLFARVSRQHPSGVAAWSSYSYKQFTMNVPNPTTPALTLSASDSNQRVSVTVNASATSGYDSSTCQVQVQRSVGGVWRDVRGMDEVGHAVGSANLVGYDYEADRGVSNSYRARVSMWHTADAVTRYSAWDTESVTGPAATGWNLKDVETPANNLLAVNLSEPQEDSQHVSGVHMPLDADRPVVVSGTLGGYGGSYQVVITGSTSMTKLDEIADGRLLLVESAFGDAKYVAVTKCSRVKRGVAADPRYVAALEYIEVGSGLDTDEV